MFNIIENTDLINDINKYDVILVGTNTYHTMGNGFQRKVRVNYPETYKLNISTRYGSSEKLGSIIATKKTTPLFVLCFITNDYNFRPDLKSDYLNYEALEKCICAVNNEYSGLKVATTMIGCGKYDGNGDVGLVTDILTRNSNNIDLYVYDYVELDRSVESAIRYLSVITNKEYDRNKKTELINKMIEDDKKLYSIDNPVKRMKRIKANIKDLLNK